MIDFHSHILPGIDDGSESVEETRKMLSMLVEQNIKTIIATPHYYAEQESVEEFLVRRKEAYDKIKDLNENINILLGAEVYYYEGIKRLNNLKDLCLENTKVILIEMPFEKWNEYIVNELIELSHRYMLQIVLAHIERYLSYGNLIYIERLIENGVLIQINASFINERKTQRKALKMLKKGYVHFIGSDCHNTHSRPPRIGEAYQTINKKFGNHFLNEMNAFEKNIIFKRK